MAEPVHEIGEGPFYKKGSPERNEIAGAGTIGDKLVVEGRVLSTDDEPVAGVWIDFWHADGNGEYDNSGFNLRGHQYTDADGRYSLQTVKPSMYGSRTAHIHVKLQAGKSSRVVTTQIYFPGEPKNESDPLFYSANLVDLQTGADGKKARFDFVLDTSA